MARGAAFVSTRSSRAQIKFILIGLLIAAGLLLALGTWTGLASRPGFLNSRAGLMADINLIAELVLLGGLTMGAGFARKGHITAHQYNQTTWVLFNILLTLFIMIASFRTNVLPQIPNGLGQSHTLVPSIHAALGGLATLCAVYLLLRMNRLLPQALQISWWKNLMRLTLALYWAVGLFGIAIYYLWYVR